MRHEEATTAEGRSGSEEAPSTQKLMGSLAVPLQELLESMVKIGERCKTLQETSGRLFGQMSAVSAGSATLPPDFAAQPVRELTDSCGQLRELSEALERASEVIVEAMSRCKVPAEEGEISGMVLRLLGTVNELRTKSAVLERAVVHLLNILGRLQPANDANASEAGKIVEPEAESHR